MNGDNASKYNLKTQYTNPDVISNIKKIYKNKKTSTHGDCNMIFDPFQVCEMNNFLSEINICHTLVDEVKKLSFVEKNNDLYSFKQTLELRNANKDCIQHFADYLQNTVRQLISKITDIKLHSKMSLMASAYSKSDTLLCHDDHLDKRRIAFILYLTPDWTKSDGGTLDLFNSDDNLEPTTIAKSTLPSFNKFAWFEVTQGSYHQVAEVLGDKTRYSIHGWFYSDEIDRDTVKPEVEVPRLSFSQVEMKTVTDFINPMYLQDDIQKNIRRKFILTSEISLNNFLKSDKYLELCSAVRAIKSWRIRGPPNKRNYDAVDALDLCDKSEDRSNNIIRQFADLMRSEAMALIVSNLTGVELSPYMVKEELSDHESDYSDGCDDSDDFEDYQQMPLGGDTSDHGDAADVDSDVEEQLDVKNAVDEQISAEDKDSNTNKDNKSEILDVQEGCCNVPIVNNSGPKSGQGSGPKSGQCSGPESCQSSISHDPSKNTLKRSLSCTSSISSDQEVGTSADNKKPKGDCTALCRRPELRQWRSGCYTLAHDLDVDNTRDTLDAMFYVNCKDWKQEYGGMTIYITKDEDEQLLTTTPADNTLALVYRDMQTLRFVKHINRKLTTPFQEIFVEYFE